MCRRALEQLIGRERASNSLQEVEIAVRADVEEKNATPASSSPVSPGASPSSITQSEETLTPPEGKILKPGEGVPIQEASRDASPATGRSETADARPLAGDSGASDDPPSGGGGVPSNRGVSGENNAGAGTGDGAAYRLPEGQLGRLLGNERLAHEILVNPEFQVPTALLAFRRCCSFRLL